MLPDSLTATLDFRKDLGAKNWHQTTSDLYILAEIEYINDNFIHGEEQRGIPQDFGSDSYQFI